MRFGKKHLWDGYLIEWSSVIYTIAKNFHWNRYSVHLKMLFTNIVSIECCGCALVRSLTKSKGCCILVSYPNLWFPSKIRRPGWLGFGLWRQFNLTSYSQHFPQPWWFAYGKVHTYILKRRHSCNTNSSQNPSPASHEKIPKLALHCPSWQCSQMTW